MKAAMQRTQDCCHCEIDLIVLGNVFKFLGERTTERNKISNFILVTN